MKTQLIPVKEFRIFCPTDSDLSQDELAVDFEKARALLLDYRECYPNDRFVLFAVVDA